MRAKNLRASSGYNMCAFITQWARGADARGIELKSSMLAFPCKRCLEEKENSRLRGVYICTHAFLNRGFGFRQLHDASKWRNHFNTLVTHITASAVLHSWTRFRTRIYSGHQKSESSIILPSLYYFNVHCLIAIAFILYMKHMWVGVEVVL